MKVFVYEVITGTPVVDTAEGWERAWRRHHLAMGAVGLAFLGWALFVTR